MEGESTGVGRCVLRAGAEVVLSEDVLVVVKELVGVEELDDVRPNINEFFPMERTGIHNRNN